ncbi:XRE family transcriptional regulator [Chromohalobacter israelensis]|uniref:XRE family transcriptional regulator n=1 Tax=Chromohalobacter israelensis TaxID=141390 RepID=UPI0015F2B2C0|nr:LexA family transcriptional regulator [Chromohalobacter israelensis]MDF9433004.1 LexA family transcriptional regulator [Chromohalobacter israelensis]
MDSNESPVKALGIYMSSIGTRLRHERERLGFTQTQMGDMAGVTKNTQRLYETDQRSPKADYLALLDAEGVDVSYVLTGRRDSASGVSAQRVSDGAPVTASSGASNDGVAVKMYDVEGAAGAGRSLEEERVEGVLRFPEAQLNALGLSPEHLAGIKVRGDSMETTLNDGDWVLVNRADTDYRQEGIFLLLISGERRIKRVQRLAGGALYLISDNEHYEPEMIPPEQMREVKILGRCEVRIGRIA